MTNGPPSRTERSLPICAPWPPTTVVELERLVSVVADLDRVTIGAHGVGVVDLGPELLDELIAALDWHDREVLVEAAAEAYYGGADRPGARMVGYSAAPTRGPLTPIVEHPVPTTSIAEIDDTYDVVVVGAGAGGAVAALVAGEAGARVLLVERGEALPLGAVGRDHLRNHRSLVHGPGIAGPTTGGVWTVGGGTRVHAGSAWRFVPDDFRMASRYGVPEDSSLADWPLTYDDLEPHYTWAEQTVGVAGDGTAHPTDGHRSRRYPMPPMPTNTEAEVLRVGADRLGLATGPVPQAINSVPFDGRARCVQCGECVGFACISNARNGAYEAIVPRALATGDVTLLTRTRAVGVTRAAERVDGIRIVTDVGVQKTVRAGHVVVAAGAIETARLLLGAGLGGDQVGRHLQGHVFVSAFGRFAEPIVDMAGPGATISTGDLRHGLDGVVGGGILGNELLKLPIVHWRWARHPEAPRWGLAAKEEMRRNYLRTSHVFGQVQEVPQAENRVVPTGATDEFGLPRLRLEGRGHPETLRTAAQLRERAVEWLDASGAAEVWVDVIPDGLTAGTHQAGTCRMGTDPATSVVDPTGRVHGHDNLWVADASVHVTNGGASPSLTIQALAHRVTTELTSR